MKNSHLPLAVFKFQNISLFPQALNGANKNANDARTNAKTAQEKYAEQASKVSNFLAS
jgi:hypothetical protein